MSVIIRRQPYVKFKLFLKDQGVTQRELATFLNKSESTLSKNLNGTGCDFSLSEIIKICNKFNINAEDFFIVHFVS